MKHLLGTVKSDKNIKTAIVDVVRFKVHPKYLKRIKVNKSYAVQNDLGANLSNFINKFIPLESEPSPTWLPPGQECK